MTNTKTFQSVEHMYILTYHRWHWFWSKELHFFFYHINKVPVPSMLYLLWKHPLLLQFTFFLLFTHPNDQATLVSLLAFNNLFECVITCDIRMFKECALGFKVIIKGVYNTSSKETRFEHHHQVLTCDHT